jgi:hypothetical protein
MLYSMMLMIDLCNFQQICERKNCSNFLISNAFILKNTNSAVPYLQRKCSFWMETVFLQT